ncbi:MAG TPA: MFS transporter, partial [Syntrophomonadaceae bacterium]|nr:MFS transporter [Syntrophomonadaceae bacterium]
VGRKDLANAIVLNSSIFNSARIVGPSIAGILIAKVGTDICFFINAISFIPVIAGIIAIEPLKREIYSVKDEDKKGWIVELKEGIFYVKSNPSIYIPLLLLAIVNIVAINFNVIVPLFSKNVFHSGAKGLGFLMSANGIGAVTGAISLAAAGKKRLKPKLLYNATLVLGLSEILMLITKTHLPAYLLLAIAGMSTITLVTTTNSLIQMQVPNHLRGRVMSIYTFVFAGLSPIGNFLTGSMANWTGAPLTIALGGLICLVIGLLFRIKTKNLEDTASLK